MNLEQKARWQHGVLFAALVGLLAGGMIFAIGITKSGTEEAAPSWVGVVIIVFSLLMGVFGILSLRTANARNQTIKRLAQGPFDLPDSASERLARLNARLTSHFGLPVATTRQPMPLTFGQLVAATTERVRTAATIQPAQHELARSTLADVLGTGRETIAWSSNPTHIIPSGRQRFRLWEQLRTAAPSLPEASLNPWVENIAIYGFLAALIAIAVPIAQRFDSNEATRVEPTPGNRVIGRAAGLLVFGSIIAVLMIPVYVIGKRYAARLPAEIDNMGALASHFPQSEVTAWTTALVTEHIRDIVSTELGVPAANLHEETSLILVR